MAYEAGIPAALIYYSLFIYKLQELLMDAGITGRVYKIIQNKKLKTKALSIYYSLRISVNDTIRLKDFLYRGFDLKMKRKFDYDEEEILRKGDKDAIITSNEKTKT
jgi:hypothetical protein